MLFVAVSGFNYLDTFGDISAAISVSGNANGITAFRVTDNNGAPCDLDAYDATVPAASRQNENSILVYGENVSFDDRGKVIRRGKIMIPPAPP